MEIYLLSNEEIENQDNFVKFKYFIKSKSSIEDYKWIIISEFMYLQGLMISGLMSSNPSNLIKGHSKIRYKSIDMKRSNNYEILDKYKVELPNVYLSPSICASDIISLKNDLHKENIKLTIEQINNAYTEIYRLVSFIELSKRLANCRYICYIADKVVLKNDSIYDLNRIRNNFIHFLPKTWAVNTGLLDNTIINCLKYSCEIIKNRINHFDYDRNGWVDEMENLIKEY